MSGVCWANKPRHMDAVHVMCLLHVAHLHFKATLATLQGYGRLRILALFVLVVVSHIHIQCSPSL